MQQPTPPDYLIVEISCLLRPTDVVNLFQQQAGSLVQFDSVIAMVDAEQIRNLEGSCAELARQQIQEADFSSLTKLT